MTNPTTTDRCRADLGRCDAYRPGHLLHTIHARLIQEGPTGWREAGVSRIEGRELFLTDGVGGVVVAWHHRLLTDLLAPGAMVLLHPRWHALHAAGAVLNVRVTGALHPQARTDDITSAAGPYVVDLSSGRGFGAGGRPRGC